MSDDPDFSRRDLLGGLAATAAAGAAPANVIETVTNVAGETLHPLATELATNVWRLHEPYYAHYPNDFQDLRAEALQYLTDLPDKWTKAPETFEDNIRAYRDAAHLLESGWTPPAQPSTVARDTEHISWSEEQTSPRTPREATRSVTLAEHIDELRAELRGSLDSSERDMIAAELKAAQAALRKHDDHEMEMTRPEIARTDANAQGLPAPKLRDDLTDDQPQDARKVGFIDYKSVESNLPGADDAKVHRGNFDSAVARLSAETGLPHTPAAGGEYVAGIYRQSLTLSSGRYAMIDNGLGFALVPWTQELDRHLGRHVAGVARESGGIEWSLGRKRGLEI